jgi:hypothetical protein
MQKQSSTPPPPVSNLEKEELAQILFDLYRESRLSYDAEAEYIFKKFTEYSASEPKLECIDKGGGEVEIHDLNGQAFDLELRDHLHHLTIARFIDLVLNNAVSARQSAAAIKRHQEHHSMKVEVFAWLNLNFDKFKSMDATAEAIAGKLVPLKFRTVRKWVKEYKDMQSAGRL